MTLNSDIKNSLKKFSLLFRQAKMVFVIVWFPNHFTLEYVPSVDGVWIVTPAGLHFLVTKLNLSLIFFKLYILTSNNVIWVGLILAILFNKVQHVVKRSTTAYEPVSYGVIDLFIKPQNFLFMSLYLIIFFFDGRG